MHDMGTVRGRGKEKMTSCTAAFLTSGSPLLLLAAPSFLLQAEAQRACQRCRIGTCVVAKPVFGREESNAD